MVVTIWPSSQEWLVGLLVCNLHENVTSWIAGNLENKIDAKKLDVAKGNYICLT